MKERMPISNIRVSPELTSEGSNPTLDEKSFSETTQRSSIIMENGEVPEQDEIQNTPEPQEGFLQNLNKEIYEAINRRIDEGSDQDEKETERHIGGYGYQSGSSEESGSENKYQGKVEQESSAQRVERLKEALVGNTGEIIRGKAKDVNEHVRYQQRIDELLEIQDYEFFLNKYENFRQEVFSKKQDELSGKVEPSEEEKEKANEYFESLKDQDEYIEHLLLILPQGAEENARAMYESSGEGLVRLAAAGTGREDEYVEMLNDILGKPENTKEGIQNLLAEIRADVATIENNADRPYSEVSDGNGEAHEESVDDSEVHNDDAGESTPTEASGGSGGGSEEPPSPPSGTPEEEPNNSDDSNESDDSDIPDTPEEMARRSQEEARSWFDDVIARLQGANDVGVLKRFLDQDIRSRLEAVASDVYDTETHKTWGQKLEEIDAMQDLGGMKAELSPFLAKMRDVFTTRMEKMERETPPQSFEELLELIMSKEADEYRAGGRRELVTEKGEIRPENFYAWVRKRAVFWSDFNGDQTTDLFNLISIPMTYRTISFNEMVTNAQYFRRRERKLVVDPDDGTQVIDPRTREPVTSETTHTDDYYESIKRNIMQDIFIYNMSRNFKVQYIDVMEQDSELPKAVNSILSKNHFTQTGKDGFKTVFSLASAALEDVAQQKTGEEENYLCGEGVALAFNIYDHISDYDKLTELLGEDAPFFSRDYIGQAGNGGLYESIKDVSYDEADGGRLEKLKDTSAVAVVDREAVAGVAGLNLVFDEEWFDENGVLKNEDWAKYQFLDYINIFNEAEKNTNIIGQLRERIRQTLAFKMLPRLEDTEVHERQRVKAGDKVLEREGITRGELEDMDDVERRNRLENEIEFESKKLLLEFAYEDSIHAEEVANSMVRWTGTGAKNDTTATGFDAATKFYETMQYRIRQGAKNRGGGSVGAIKDIGIYKRLLAPVTKGVLTSSRFDGENLTPSEIAERIGRNIGKKDEKPVFTGDIKDNIAFADNALKSYGGNHFVRGGSIFENLAGAEELDLSKIATYDPVKGTVIDKHALIEELNEKYLKPERYRSATYSGVDYRKEFRFLDNMLSAPEITGDGKRYRRLEYKDKSMAEAMFGQQVFDREYRYKNQAEAAAAGKNVGDVNVDKVQSQRSAFWKEGILVRLAAQLAAHRDSKDPAEQWNLSRVEAFIDALTSVPADVEVDEKNFWNNKAKDRFIDKKMEKDFRKLSRTEKWRIYGWAATTDIGGGLAAGLFEATREFAKEVVS